MHALELHRSGIPCPAPGQGVGTAGRPRSTPWPPRPRARSPSCVTTTERWRSCSSESRSWGRAPPRPGATSGGRYPGAVDPRLGGGAGLLSRPRGCPARREAGRGQEPRAHHAAKSILAELDRMRPSSDRYEAKLLVLIGAVNDHVEEEESELFPKVQEALGHAAERDRRGDGPGQEDCADQATPARPTRLRGTWPTWRSPWSTGLAQRSRKRPAARDGGRRAVDGGMARPVHAPPSPRPAESPRRPEGMPAAVAADRTSSALR